MNTIFKTALLVLPLSLITACGGGEPQISLTDIAQAAARQEDQVNVHDLATWLIEGRGDFQLIDVRKPEDFERGQIGEAKNIPIAQLFSEDVLAGLPRDRKVIVYSRGSQNAAKAAVLLRLSGINGYVLKGGYKAWHKQVLNPDISDQALAGESNQVSEQRAYACYFVGERSGAAQLQRSSTSEPFVPPVFEETEEIDEMPPPAAEEGC